MSGTFEESRATELRTRVADLPNGTFTLRLIRGEPSGVSLTIDGAAPSRLLVGTSPAADLRLADPLVSRRHLALELRGSELSVTDLGSTNGTLVGGLSVVEARLRGGETLRLGDTLLAVERNPNGANAEVPPGTNFGRVFGASRAMRRLYPRCARLAASTIPVVLEGETGTGKEVLAEALHEESPRASGPFIVFDCTAVPPSLLEAELFGHERGAFTGALTARKGVFEQAHGGTLFIDEIGDLDAALQPKLLRAIERSEVKRVGGDRWIRVDVRVIAATRRDLDRAVQEGRFRDNLFHRIAVGRIELPGLRARSGDIELLASRFWEELGGAGPVPAAYLASWCGESWPGNVRELRNAVARAVAFGEIESSAPASRAPQDEGIDLERMVEAAVNAGEPMARVRQRVIEVFERIYLEAMLAAHGGVVTHAATAAGVARRHFQRLRARARDT